jgi:alpha-ribazole phosphatase
MKVYFIRHTSVAVPKGICYGQTDVPLNTSFEEEACAVKERLGTLSPEAVFSSPLSRCTRLAHFCGFNDVILDERLKELDFGDWEGRGWDDIDMSVWTTDWINPPVPGGESFTGIYKRVASFLDKLKKETFNTVLIFTHGGVISCAHIYFGQTDFNNTFHRTPQYGEIIEYDL